MGVVGLDRQIVKKERTIGQSTFYREHLKEVDAWAEKGARGLKEEWEDKTDLDWSDAA